MLDFFGFNSTTKSKIVEILSVEWPLSARSIHQNLVRNQGIDVSYQATHKSLKDLLDGTVLIERDKKYSLNVSWIQKTRNQLDSLEKTIALSGGIQPGETISLNYDSYQDFTKSMLNLLFEERKNNPVGTCCVFQKNFYWVWGCSLEEMKQLKFLGKHGGYMVSSSDSFGNNLIGKFYSSLGYNVKTGIDFGSKFDFIVYNDLIYQIFLSEKQKQQFKEYYSEIKENSLWNQQYPERLFEEKGNIQVIIFKNKVFAGKLKQEILSYFGEAHA